MPSADARRATLTMSDIAEAAGVRRAVVSMWRGRPNTRHGHHPFPSPVATNAGAEHFDRDEVVDWLSRTARGNNREHRADAPALSVPLGSTHDELLTLLCLWAATGAELSGCTPQELGQLAIEADPDDQLLLRETRALRPEHATLRFVDDLVEVSYGAADALRRLDAGRSGRQVAPRGLAAAAITTLRAVIAAVAQHLDADGVPVVAHDAATVALDLASSSHLVVPGEGAEARRLRRRALLLGVRTSPATSAAVHVTSVLGLAPDRALDALDVAILDLGPSDAAVLVGPARLMCDELVGAAENARAGTLRAGALAMALRLPRGWWREAHRQSLGLWICLGQQGRTRIRVGDLGSLARDTLDLNDLAADVAGALAGGEDRAFRYVRGRDLADVLAGGPVVPRGARGQRLATRPPASHLARVRALGVQASEPVAGVEVLVEDAPGDVMLRQRSLGELRLAGQLVRLRGSRFDAAHTDPEGSVEVLNASGDVLLRLDAFDAEERYPQAQRTEPGDVVFTQKPPRAVVDRRGGSLVASPAQILRLRPSAGIGPYTLAALVNSDVTQAAEWQGWAVPLLRPSRAVALEDAMRVIAEHEALVRGRLDVVRALQHALIEGVTAGAVLPTTQSTTDAIKPTETKAG